jgi:hypothetical protein
MAKPPAHFLPASRSVARVCSAPVGVVGPEGGQRLGDVERVDRRLLGLLLRHVRELLQRGHALLGRLGLLDDEPLGARRRLTRRQGRQHLSDGLALGLVDGEGVGLEDVVLPRLRDLVVLDVALGDHELLQLVGGERLRRRLLGLGRAALRLLVLTALLAATAGGEQKREGDRGSGQDGTTNGSRTNGGRTDGGNSHCASPVINALRPGTAQSSREQDQRGRARVVLGES